MTHEGLYIDKQQPPRGHCAPELINQKPGTRIKGRTFRHIHRVRKVYRGQDGKRHYGKFHTKRTCRFPSTVTRQVTLTYAIA